MVENPGVLRSVCFMFCSGDEPWLRGFFWIDHRILCLRWGFGGLSWFVTNSCINEWMICQQKVRFTTYIYIYEKSTKTASVSKTKNGIQILTHINGVCDQPGACNGKVCRDTLQPKNQPWNTLFTLLEGPLPDFLRGGSISFFKEVCITIGNHGFSANKHMI